MTTMRPPGCLGDEQITELGEGLLSGAALDEAERHVAECATCRSLVVLVAQAARPAAGHDSRATIVTDELTLRTVDPSAYEVGREIARGGMGRILEAWDDRHRRRVAIKVLLKPGPAAKLRFLREVRITGRLQHPAIVPLYEAGLWPNGEPFFAMRLVVGRPLGQVVDDTPTLRDRLALLPHVIALTDALAYAHEQRVVHRDLKPSNVLVGTFGETVVIDWGLAKELGAEDADDAANETAADAVSSDAALTRAGVAVGTPCYMPPEQARGAPIDARADVYALGALLYHVLAGSAPYQAPSSETTIDRVLAGPPAPLRERARDVPPDLATIVEKAMSRDPGARYPTAGAMAEDLKRFEAGKLVAAHDYSLGTLVRRWAGRHRAAMIAAALLVVAVVGIGTVSVRRVVLERDRADGASVVAERERRTAVTQRDAAEKLVGFVISDLRDRLKELGRLALLGGVGRKVDDYYQAVAPVSGADDATLARRASALETLAEVEDAKHDTGEARALYESARALRRRIVELRGDDAARAEEGELLVKVARFELSQHGEDAAAAPSDEARDIGDAIVARSPSSVAGLALVAAAREVVARRRAAAPDLDAAAAEATIAAEAARRLVAIEADTPRALRLLGAALFSKGRVSFLAARFDDPSMDESVQVRERLSPLAPGNAGDKLDLSESYERRGFGRRDTGRFESAVEDEKHAVALRRELVEHDPDNNEWQQMLGQAYGSLCSTQHFAKHDVDSVASCQKSIEILARLVAQTPDAPTASDLLVIAYQNLGWIFIEIGRTREAEANLRSSVTVAQPFADRGNKVSIARVADAHGLLAELALATGRTEDARRELATTIALMEPWETQSAGYTVWRTLIVTRYELAQLDADAGDEAEARRLRVASLRLFTREKVDMNDELTLENLSRACVALLPTKDADLRTMIESAIAILETPRFEGADPRKRLAILARARALLGASEK